MAQSADLSAGIVVPETPAAPAAAPAASPAPAAAPAANPILATDLPPDKLKERLDQARQRGQSDLLTEFGVKKPDELKAALKRLKELEDARLTDEERTKKQLAELIPKAAEADVWKQRFSRRVAADLAALPEEQRAIVTSMAGDDPDQQDKFITAIRMAAAVTPGAAAAPATPPAPVAPPPANSVPRGTPPAPSIGAVKTAFERWQALEETNPLGASIFLAANRTAIDASRPA